jgi:dihydroxy-acid dehydratase
MVRISDARMSGTAYGTIVLHISPEAAIGGNLALVQNGDMIELDANKRRLQVLLDDAELEARRAAWKPPQLTRQRGYLRLHLEQVQQAHLGCDLEFLRPPMRTTLS